MGGRPDRGRGSGIFGKPQRNQIQGLEREGKKGQCPLCFTLVLNNKAVFLEKWGGGQDLLYIIITWGNKVLSQLLLFPALASTQGPFSQIVCILRGEGKSQGHYQTADLDVQC